MGISLKFIFFSYGISVEYENNISRVFIAAFSFKFSVTAGQSGWASGGFSLDVKP